jgi:hypothetical protein
MSECIDFPVCKEAKDENTDNDYEHEEDEEASASAARLQVEATTHTHIQDARIAAVQHPRPLAFVPTLTQITNFSSIHHTRPAERAAFSV